MSASPTIIPFFNQANTSINYGEALRDAHGKIPQVRVMYWDEGLEQYRGAGAFTRVALVPEAGTLAAAIMAGDPNPAPEVESIEIDHGGISTGLIKIG